MARTFLLILIPLIIYSCGWKIQSAVTKEGKKVYYRLYSKDEKQDQYENTIRFKRLYSKMAFERYTSKVIAGTANDYTYFQYDSVRIYIDSSPVDGNKGLKYAVIFESGLITPNIIACALNTICTAPQDSVEQLYIENMYIDGDSVSFMGTYLAFDQDFLKKKYNWTGSKIYISDIQELPYLENKRTRVFKLEHKIHKGGPTNSYYYLELTNESSNKNTSLDEFLKDAELTFLRYSHTTYEI